MILLAGLMAFVVAVVLDQVIQYKSNETNEPTVHELNNVAYDEAIIKAIRRGSLMVPLAKIAKQFYIPKRRSAIKELYRRMLEKVSNVVQFLLVLSTSMMHNDLNKQDRLHTYLINVETTCILC